METVTREFIGSDVGADGPGHGGFGEQVSDHLAQLLLRPDDVLVLIFKEYLNRTPGAYAQLLADTEVRKRFELGKIPIERVADFGFDLSAKLGELLADQNDLADLGTIKVTMLALFPANVRLRTALTQRDLWTLFQRRHLIVHRRGIVDRRYLEATGEGREIGARLAITPQELTKHLGVVVEAAGALVAAAG